MCKKTSYYVVLLIGLWSFKIYSLNNERISFNTLEALYDYWADDYKNLVALTDYKIADWFFSKKNLLSSEKNTVLDLGCADGFIGELLLKLRPNYELYGIDFSKKMVKNCLMKNLYSEVIQADLSNGLPEIMCDRKYDMVITTGCLEFIQNHDALFFQIYHVLKKGGQFWFTLRIDEENLPRIALDKTLNLYSKKRLYAILEKHNFKVIDITCYPTAYTMSQQKEPVPYFMIIVYK